MKALTRMTCVFVLILFFSSCGVITKTRYGNGLKLNVNLNVFKKDDTRSGKTRERAQRLTVIAKNTKIPRQTFSKKNSDFAPQIENLLSQDEVLINLPTTGLMAKEQLKTHIERKLIFEVGQVTNKAEKILPARPAKRKKNGPLEPITLIGAIFFYGAIVAFIFAAITKMPLVGWFITLLLICILIGFIMSIIGLRRIDSSKKPFSGTDLGESVVKIVMRIVLSFLAFVLIAIIFGAK